MPEKLSVFIITKNEEEKIARCLEHLKWADEIIVMDSYSTDKTKDIAKRYTKKFYERRFDGYGQQKQAAIDKCTNTWILEVDADEIVPEQLKNEIIILLDKKEKLEMYDAYAIKRQEYFLRKPLMISKVIRLYRKDKIRYEGIIHEKVRVAGRIGELQNMIIHESDKYNTIAKIIDKINEYTGIEAKKIYTEKKPGIIQVIFFMVTIPIIYFLWMYIKKGLIFRGYRGLIWSILTLYYHFLIYSKVYEYIYKSKKILHLNVGFFY